MTSGERVEGAKCADFDDLHLAGSAGFLEYLTIANLYLFINNNREKLTESVCFVCVCHY